MKKIPYSCILLFFGAVAAANAQAPLTCTGAKPACTASGAAPTCIDMRGAYKIGDPAVPGWHCPEWPMPAGLQGAGKETDATKKAEAADPCDKTLIPNYAPTRGTMPIPNPVIPKAPPAPTVWMNILGLSPKPSTGSGAAGIVAGDDVCKWENSPEEDEFNACTEALRPKNQFTNWPEVYAKCKEIHRAACGSDPACLKAAATYPVPGKMNCQTKKLSGSVIDTLWDFVTHKKTY